MPLPLLLSPLSLKVIITLLLVLSKVGVTYCVAASLKNVSEPRLTEVLLIVATLAAPLSRLPASTYVTKNLLLDESKTT